MYSGNLTRFLNLLDLSIFYEVRVICISGLKSNISLLWSFFYFSLFYSPFLLLTTAEITPYSFILLYDFTLAVSNPLKNYVETSTIILQILSEFAVSPSLSIEFVGYSQKKIAMCFPSPFESIRDIASAIGGRHSGANRDTNANRDANDTTTDRATTKLEKRILKAKLKFEKKEAKELKKAEKKREKERKKEMNAAKKKQPPTTDGVSDVQNQNQSSESLGSRIGNNSHHHGDCSCRHHGCAVSVCLDPFRFLKYWI